MMYVLILESTCHKSTLCNMCDCCFYLFLYCKRTINYLFHFAYVTFLVLLCYVQSFFIISIKFLIFYALCNTTIYLTIYFVLRFSFSYEFVVISFESLNGLEEDILNVLVTRCCSIHIT